MKMLAALLTFVNSHFSGLVAGVAAESSIVSIIYGIVANDMVFAIALAALVCVLAFAANRFFAVRQPNCFEIENVGTNPN